MSAIKETLRSASLKPQTGQGPEQSSFRLGNNCFQSSHCFNRNFQQYHNIIGKNNILYFK